MNREEFKIFKKELRHRIETETMVLITRKIEEGYNITEIEIEYALVEIANIIDAAKLF